MDMQDRPLIVGIGGTMRTQSSSERALAISLAAASRRGAQTILVSGRNLDLPMYDPRMTDRSSAAKELLDLLRRCNGLIISSPSYHGGISGLIKNALDYTEDMSRDVRVYFDGVPVGLIGCGAGWQGANQTLIMLRGIVHALRGWPTPLGVAVNTANPLFDDDGNCVNDNIKSQLETVGQQVANFIAFKGAAECGARV